MYISMSFSVGAKIFIGANFTLKNSSLVSILKELCIPMGTIEIAIPIVTYIHCMDMYALCRRSVEMPIQ
jgi:hypothetical protein